MHIRLIVVASLTLSVTLEAQWLNHPTRGAPRGPDGKPSLAAPAPRTADGKPDFSGIWQLEPDAPCPALGCQVDYPVGVEFRNLGAKLPGGALPYQPWAAALVKERTEQLGKDDPVGFCKPGGAVRILTYPPYRKFIQLPDLFVILSERDVTYRQIFIDGRPLPQDPDPTFNGYSTGRWEGDALVVQTNGLRGGTWSIATAARSAKRRR